MLVSHSRASLVPRMVKHLPAIRETWVQSLDWEDPLEEKMATHSSILAWRIPWTEEPGGLSSMVSERVRQTEDACTRVKPGLLVCGHTLFLQQWSSAGAAFCICPLLQGTTGNVWRLFWCHDWGHVPGI